METKVQRTPDTVPYINCIKLSQELNENYLGRDNENFIFCSTLLCIEAKVDLDMYCVKPHYS